MMENKRKIRWGVIGCGGIADRRTLPGMMLCDNVELVAVMDTDFAAASRCREKYGAKYAFTDVDSLLSLSEIEAVYIATPVFCHKAQVEAAAKMGKHILVEKPVGLSVEEAKEIESLCQTYGVRLGVGLVMRFHSIHETIKNAIKEGKLGEIVSARAQLSCYYPEMPGVWRQDFTKSGGGALMDMGVHCVDLIRYLTGLSVTEVYGMTGNQVFHYGVEDAGAILMRLENGATAYVDANFNVPDTSVVCRLEIYGTQGSVLCDNTIGQSDTGSAVFRLSETNDGYDAAQTRNSDATITINGKNGNIYASEIQQFGDAILNNDIVPVSAKDAIMSQAVVEAAYESQKNGIIIHIK